MDHVSTERITGADVHRIVATPDRERLWRDVEQARIGVALAGGSLTSRRLLARAWNAYAAVAGLPSVGEL